MTYIERLSLEFCPKVIKYFLTMQTFTKKPPSRPSPTQPLSPSLSPILSGERGRVDSRRASSVHTLSVPHTR